MAFQVEGKLHKIFETEQKSEKFRAREFVIEIIDGSYAQMIKFQLTQDKCELIDDHNEGDQINVHFNLTGREWNDRYFTNLQAWRLEAGGASEQNAPQTQGAGNSKKPTPNEDFSDDIPF